MLKTRALKINGEMVVETLKPALMEKTVYLTELNEAELKEISGGAFPMLIIKLFGPDLEGLMAFWNGVKAGYIRTTPQ